MDNAAQTVEQAAIMAAGIISGRAVTQLHRALMMAKTSPAVMDWMLERGYLAMRRAGAAPYQNVKADVLPYLTRAGRAWCAQ